MIRACRCLLKADGLDAISKWQHLHCRDILSVPDKWEYPWFAGWDLAFHMLPFSRIDPHFAKEQLILLLREWYMHPNGQVPAYEFAFGDVNLPVHAIHPYPTQSEAIRQAADAYNRMRLTPFAKTLFSRLMAWRR